MPLGHAAAAAQADPMDAPLAASAVDRAVGEAMRLSRNSDEMALAANSRDCHHRFRLQPTLAALDGCAAFDDAVGYSRIAIPCATRARSAKLR